MYVLNTSTVIMIHINLFINNFKSSNNNELNVSQEQNPARKESILTIAKT